MIQYAALMKIIPTAEMEIAMLFDRNIEPLCAYCRYGSALGQDEIACIRRGIMESSGSCGAFRYEPTKRVPKVMPRLDSKGVSEGDFTL